MSIYRGLGRSLRSDESLVPMLLDKVDKSGGIRQDDIQYVVHRV